MRRRVLLFAAALALAACVSTAHERRFPMEGDIKGLDAASKIAIIDAGKIGDWMEAMTMEYAVKPDSEFAKLKVGDHIKGTVVVLDDGRYYVTAITVVAKR